MTTPRETMHVEHVVDPFEGVWEYHVVNSGGEPMALCSRVVTADVIAALLNHPEFERLKAEALATAYREASR